MAQSTAKGIGAFNHRVFGQEPCKAIIGQRDTNARDGQCANHHGRECIGNLLPQSAVIVHILLMMHRVDDGACAKEQHGLEECVGKEVGREIEDNLSLCTYEDAKCHDN